MDVIRRHVLAAGLGAALLALTASAWGLEPAGKRYQVVVDGMT